MSRPTTSNHSGSSLAFSSTCPDASNGQTPVAYLYATFILPFLSSLSWVAMRESLSLSDIPRMAQEPDAEKVFDKQRSLPTSHRLYLGDSRDLSVLPDESLHLAVTSPPYWILKDYPPREGQLGLIEDYEKFHDELSKVWREVHRVLVPGGRLICVVGDVCLSRRKFGRHVVFPLHSDITIQCRKIGFDNL